LIPEEAKPNSMLFTLGQDVLGAYGSCNPIPRFLWAANENEGLSSTNEDAKGRRQDAYKSEVNISFVDMTGGSTSVVGVRLKM
jgi:hypothetical protein